MLAKNCSSFHKNSVENNTKLIWFINFGCQARSFPSQQTMHMYKNGRILRQYGRNRELENWTREKKENENNNHNGFEWLPHCAMQSHTLAEYVKYVDVPQSDRGNISWNYNLSARPYRSEAQHVDCVLCYRCRYCYCSSSENFSADDFCFSVLLQFVDV